MEEWMIRGQNASKKFYEDGLGTERMGKRREAREEATNKIIEEITRWRGGRTDDKGRK